MIKKSHLPPKMLFLVSQSGIVVQIDLVGATQRHLSQVEFVRQNEPTRQEFVSPLKDKKFI